MKKLRKLALFTLTLSLSNCSSNSWFGEDKIATITGDRVPVAEKSQDLEVESTISSLSFSADSTVNPTVLNGNQVYSDNSNFHLDFKDSPSTSFSYSSHGSLVYPIEPVVMDDKLYFIEANGYIKSYSLETGELLWENSKIYEQFNAGLTNIFRSHFVAGGLKIDENILYATFGLNHVLAVNLENGETLWDAKLSSPTRAIPVRHNDDIIIQTIDNKIFALSKTDGSIVWSRLGTQSEISILNIFAPVLKGDILYSKESNDEVYFLNATTGEELGESSIASKSSSRGLAKTAIMNFDGKLFPDHDALYAVNSRGYLVRIKSQNGEVEYLKDLKINRDLLIVQDYIFTISNNYTLIAVNKNNGSVKWKLDLTKKKDNGKIDTDYFLNTPIMANGQLFVLDNQGNAQIIDPSNGKVLKTLEGLTENVYLKPMVWNGKLVLASDKGSIDIY